MAHVHRLVLSLAFLAASNAALAGWKVTYGPNNTACLPTRIEACNAAKPFVVGAPPLTADISSGTCRLTAGAETYLNADIFGCTNPCADVAGATIELPEYFVGHTAAGQSSPPPVVPESLCLASGNGASCTATKGNSVRFPRPNSQGGLTWFEGSSVTVTSASCTTPTVPPTPTPPPPCGGTLGTVNGELRCIRSLAGPAAGAAAAAAGASPAAAAAASDAATSATAAGASAAGAAAAGAAAAAAAAAGAATAAAAAAGAAAAAAFGSATSAGSSPAASNAAAAAAGSAAAVGSSPATAAAAGSAAAIAAGRGYSPAAAAASGSAAVSASTAAAASATAAGASPATAAAAGLAAAQAAGNAAANGSGSSAAAAAGAAAGAATAAALSNGASSSEAASAGSAAGSAAANAPPKPPASGASSPSPPASSPGASCVDKPDGPGCKKEGSAGGTCGAFSCDGDALQCSMARSTFDTQCALTKEKGETPLLDAAIAEIGNPMDKGSNNSTIAFGPSFFDTSNAFAGGTACIQDFPVFIPGINKTFIMEVSKVCPGLNMFGTVLMMVGFVMAATIVFKGA